MSTTGIVLLWTGIVVFWAIVFHVVRRHGKRRHNANGEAR